MITYHFSVLFKNSTIKHHGTFDSILTDVEQLKKISKIELSKKIPIWKKDVKDIEMFEIYYYSQDKEIQVFKYEV